MTSPLTSISQIGEFGLIDRLTSGIILHQGNTIKGVGDDAAVIDGDGRHWLISTDLLAEGVHFDLGYVPMKHLGYKAAVVNFSDIAAMNGRPTHLLVSLASSSRFTVEALEELYSGLRQACEKYHVDLIGGDTSSSRSGLVLSLTVIGECSPADTVYRSGASEGDLLCVSGDLGAAYMGLLVLEREKKVFEVNPQAQPELDGYDYILRRQLKPEPRLDIIEQLANKEVKPTSMIDISDGLSSEILHLCKNSGLGCRLYEEKVPIDEETASTSRSFNIEPIVAALSGGEDYELLFTVQQSDYEMIKDIQGLEVIGHMTAPGGKALLVTSAGTEHEIIAQGWRHGSTEYPILNTE
jgi:thiamine-monophosphate kinase